MTVTAQNVIDLARLMAGVSSQGGFGDDQLLALVGDAQEHLRGDIARLYPGALAAKATYTYPANTTAGVSLTTISASLAAAARIFQIDDTGNKLDIQIVSRQQATEHLGVVAVIEGETLFLLEGFGRSAATAAKTLAIWYVAASTAPTTAASVLAVPAFCESQCKHAMSAFVAVYFNVNRREDARAERQAGIADSDLEAVFAICRSRISGGMMLPDPDRGLEGDIYDVELH